MSRGWMDRASCKEIDGDLWFAEGTNFIVTKIAKKICGTCPVVDQCLQYALENRIDYGVWGALTIQERRSLLRKNKVPRKR